MTFLEKINFFFTDYINGYSFGDPERNGEYRFLRKILKTKMIVFDVGANVGEYSKHLLSIESDITIHAFEPVKSTFETLQRNIQGENVISNNFGLSDREGEISINVYGDNSGMNSLHDLAHAQSINQDYEKQIIQIGTIDKYVKENDVENIDFLKIDVEGNEVNVLRGCRVSLGKGIIKRIQFEYGGSFKDAHEKIETIFNLLLPEKYSLFRLTPWGKIPTAKFSEQLENYKHCNYVAILND